LQQLPEFTGGDHALLAAGAPPNRPEGGRMPRSVAVTVLAAAVSLLPAVGGAEARQAATAARLKEGRLSATPIVAIGGGEVVLELTVSADGRVTQISQLRATPPYTDLVADAVRAWQFEPTTKAVEGRGVAAVGPVLVAAVFRPPSLYAGPAAGTPPRTTGGPSARLPGVDSLVMPGYLATAVGDVLVLIEIEMSRTAQPIAYRILGPASGFDDAALDAVGDWRFSAPPSPDVPERLFVYAVVGFRTPVAALTR
jgi:hypothetical protein